MASMVAGKVDTIVILAGGFGTRLWPVSTPTRPKQFFDPGIGRSLLRATIERAAALSTTAPIIIVTHIGHVDATRTECAGLQPQTAARIVILAEPHARNSAPAIIYAALWRTQHADGDPSQRTTLVMPADHLITATERFSADIGTADRLARRGSLVLFGIRPTYPATGYGYIETGKPIAAEHTAERTTDIGYTIVRFREKPDSATAGYWWNSGRHWWNSGLLICRDDILLEQLEHHVQAIWQPFAALRSRGSHAVNMTAPLSPSAGPQVIEPDRQLDELYRRLTPTSIDYALLEHSEQIGLLPAHFDWSDIGSWDEVAALHEGQGRAQSGPAALQIESRNNFIFADMPVALCGVEDAIVVAWKGSLLVCHRRRSQLVGQIPDRVEIKPAQVLDNKLSG